MPERIQLSRRKGWRKPENTVVVARPSKWGNPYVVGKTLLLFTGDSEANFIGSFDRIQRIESMTAETAAAMYRLLWLTNWNVGDADVPRAAPGDLAELRGKNLACWCPLDQPCHADVLLELANQGREAGKPVSAEDVLRREELRARLNGLIDSEGVRYGSVHGHRSMIPLPPRSRTRCRCGCGRRSTHVGLGDGLALTDGCELSIRCWVRDGYPGSGSTSEGAQ